MFTWQNMGDTARLFIDNGGIGGSYRSGIENSICIHLDIAKAFNLVVPKSGRANSRDLGYQLTSLVEARYFRDPISHVLKIRGSDVVWSIFDADQVGFKPGGNVTKSKITVIFVGKLVLIRTQSFLSQSRCVYQSLQKDSLRVLGSSTDAIGGWFRNRLVESSCL